MEQFYRSRSYFRGEASSRTKESTGNLNDLLNCFICLQKVRNAVMCPQCSKLCCEQCIKVIYTIFVEVDHRTKI